jgi:hypothetical protein
MKKVIIKNKKGLQTHGSEMADPTEWIASCVAGNVWGKHERIVDDIQGSYDPADVIEKFTVTIKEPVIAYEIKPDESGNMVEAPFEMEPGIYEHKVKLKAEYTIEIEDITYEYELNEVISKRKSEYPTMEEFMNAYFDGGEVAVQDLQNKRLGIKAKYPKPVKE